METTKVLMIATETPYARLALVVDVEFKEHTDGHPFCFDPLCFCKETIDPSTGETTDYYLEHIRIPYQAGLLSRDEKERIYNGWHI